MRSRGAGNATSCDRLVDRLTVFGAGRPASTLHPPEFTGYCFENAIGKETTISNKTDTQLLGVFERAIVRPLTRFFDGVQSDDDLNRAQEAISQLIPRMTNTLSTPDRKRLIALLNNMFRRF